MLLIVANLVVLSPLSHCLCATTLAAPRSTAGVSNVAFCRLENTSHALWLRVIGKYARISRSSEDVMGAPKFVPATGCIYWMARCEGTATPQYAILVTDIAKRTTRVVYRDELMDPLSAIAVSGDGKHLFYTRLCVKKNQSTSSHQVWRVNADGSHAAKVTDMARRPSISPNGRILAVVTDSLDTGGLLGLINSVTGRGPSFKIPVVGPVVWHPTGKILLITKAGPDGKPFQTRVALYNLATKRAVEICPTHTTYSQMNPSCSPDGRLIAFYNVNLSSNVGKMQVFNIVTGKTVTVVSEMTGLVGSIVWHPNGNELYYETVEPGGNGMVNTRLVSIDTRQVTEEIKNASELCILGKSL